MTIENLQLELVPWCLNGYGKSMEENSSDKLMRVAKAALFGFLGATIIIHITPLARPIIRDF